jgi:hypothetical protein
MPIDYKGMPDVILPPVSRQEETRGSAGDPGRDEDDAALRSLLADHVEMLSVHEELRRLRLLVEAWSRRPCEFSAPPCPEDPRSPDPITWCAPCQARATLTRRK